jgi:hypothetical protein
MTIKPKRAIHIISKRIAHIYLIKMTQLMNSNIITRIRPYRGRIKRRKNVRGMEGVMALQFGIKEIDDQHAEITRLFDGMTDSIKLRKSILDAHYRIVRLQEAVGHHFTFEESLMRLFRYPRLDAHIALHANIPEQV